jgi:hypothetical protein
VGCASAFQAEDSGFESHHSLLKMPPQLNGAGSRLVRGLFAGSTPAGGPGCLKLGDRLTGRMADSDSADRGSNPRLPVIFFLGA